MSKYILNCRFQTWLLLYGRLSLLATTYKKYDWFPDGGMSMDDAVGVENMSVDQELLAASGASEEMVKLMPEYLVVCCWRSVKEVSLLLGQLTQDAPVQDPGRNDTVGLLTCQQVRS